MVGSQSILLDGNAAVVHLLSLLKLPAGLQQDGNVVQAGGHIHMVWSQLLLSDVQNLQQSTFIGMFAASQLGCASCIFQIGSMYQQ